MVRYFCLLVFLALAFFVSIGNAIAQYSVNTSHYMYNTLILNPAYAGSKGYLTVAGTLRQKLSGIGGNKTQSFSAHLPVLKDKFGVGMILINDQYTVSSHQDFSAIGSYKLFYPQKSLSFGFGMTISNYSSDMDKLQLSNPNDPFFQSYQNNILPSFNVATYFQTNSYYFGLSWMNMGKKFIETDLNAIFSVNAESLIFIGGFLYELSEKVVLKPNIRIHYQGNTVLTMDLNVNTYYKELFGVGLSLRALNSVVCLLEFAISKHMTFVYSHEFGNRNVSALANMQEITISYTFNDKIIKRITNPKYF